MHFFLNCLNNVYKQDIVESVMQSNDVLIGNRLTDVLWNAGANTWTRFLYDISLDLLMR